jgi:hypothetical protein
VYANAVTLGLNGREIPRKLTVPYLRHTLAKIGTGRTLKQEPAILKQTEANLGVGHRQQPHELDDVGGLGVFRF